MYESILFIISITIILFLLIIVDVLKDYYFIIKNKWIRKNASYNKKREI